MPQKTWWVPFEGGFIIEADAADQANARARSFLDAIARAGAEERLRLGVSSEVHLHTERTERWLERQARRRRERKREDEGD